MPRARCVSHTTLVPLGQPEKAMGHESPIEPWLAPDNRAACGLRTDWLRCAKAMKTAGREDQKRWLNEAASREHGTEGQNNLAQRSGLEAKKKSGRGKGVFFLDSFYRTDQASESQSVNTSAFLVTYRVRLPTTGPGCECNRLLASLDIKFQLPVSLELMTERPSLRRLRFRGLCGHDASLFSAHEHLHGALAFARLVGVFVGVR